MTLNSTLKKVLQENPVEHTTITYEGSGVVQRCLSQDEEVEELVYILRYREQELDRKKYQAPYKPQEHIRAMALRRHHELDFPMHLLPEGWSPHYPCSVAFYTRRVLTELGDNTWFRRGGLKVQAEVVSRLLDSSGVSTVLLPAFLDFGHALDIALQKPLLTHLFYSLKNNLTLESYLLTLSLFTFLSPLQIKLLYKYAKDLPIHEQAIAFDKLLQFASSTHPWICGGTTPKAPELVKPSLDHLLSLLDSSNLEVKLYVAAVIINKIYPLSTQDQTHYALLFAKQYPNLRPHLKHEQRNYYDLKLKAYGVMLPKFV